MTRTITRKAFQDVVKNDFNRADLKAAMAKEPLLTCHGIGPYTACLPKSKTERDLRLAHDRKTLEGYVFQFQLACYWLKCQKKTRTINRKRSSYGLKEWVEDWAKANCLETTYVSNGAFIAAAIHLGFHYEIYHTHMSPNVGINIPNKLTSPPSPKAVQA